MMRRLILPFILLSTTLTFGQFTNFNTQKNWSLNKKELVFGIGATQFTGDVGGGQKDARHYSLADMDIRATGVSGMIGFRYRFRPRFATTSLFNFGLIRGNDAYSDDIIRFSRNINFRSFVFEIQQRLEFIVYANEKFGARYLPGGKAMKNHNEQIYVFGGLGVSYFISQSKYNGEWYNLRNLGTEGQGLSGGPSKYSPFTLTMPFGVGFRYGLGRVWRIGIEATYVKTFTDYIDDVHGVYVDPSKLSSPAAQYLSNPSQQNQGWFAPGQVRGSNQNDAYYYLNFVVQRNITYKHSNSTIRTYRWVRRNYKF
jgi:hypothetical protein